MPRTVPTQYHRFTAAQKRARRERIQRISEKLRQIASELEELECGVPDIHFDHLGELGNWLDHAK